MIEDPREVERKRLLGIDDADTPTREDLAAVLEEVNEGKIPRDRIALQMLADEMVQWPNLEVEATKKGPRKSLYAKATDTGVDPEVAAKRLNIDWDTAAEIEEEAASDESEVPSVLGYGALYLVTAFPVIIGMERSLLIMFEMKGRDEMVKREAYVGMLRGMKYKRYNGVRECELSHVDIIWERKSEPPESEASTFAITTRSGFITRDPPFQHRRNQRLSTALIGRLKKKCLSPWVSHVQVVIKKGVMTVVKNEKNELIPQRTVTGCKYKIPRDLHPRLPSEDFVMFELPNDAIGIYHRMFDFSGVQIPFSSFLLALIKHYRVHFSQLGPLGLNKKSGFFLIDRRAIPDAMVWRHTNAAIDDPRPAAGSFNMVDVQRLSAHVIKLRDMPEGMPTLKRLPFYCTPPTVAEAVIPDHTSEDLAAGTPSFKIVAKAEASQNTTHPSLFVGDDDESDDDDDDACVEIPLVTPLRSAVVIPSSGNQGRSFVAPTTEGSNTRDSWGKGVMVDDANAPSFGVSRPRPSSGPASSFKDVSNDTIHIDFFPFSAGPYYATYPEGGVARNCEFTREEWDAPYRPTFGVLTKEVFKDPTVCKTMMHKFPTSGEMVRVESLSDDQPTAKMSVLNYMIMGHGDALKKQVFGLNDNLTSSDASFDKSKGKGKERKKKIKSLGKSLDNLHAEVARLSAAFNQVTILEAERDEEILRLKATPLNLPLISQNDYAFLNKIYEYATEPLSVILQLEPEILVYPANVPIPRGTRISPPITKDSTVTHVFESLELFANVNFTAFVVAFKHNEEMVNTKVDGSDPKMTNNNAAAKSEHAFVHGISVALDDVMKLVEVRSGRVPSSPDDVVVAFSAHEKGDGLDSSFGYGKEATVNLPSGSSHDVVVHQSPLLRRRDHCVSSSGFMLKLVCFNFAFPYVFRVYELDTTYQTFYPEMRIEFCSLDGVSLLPNNTTYFVNSICRIEEDDPDDIADIFKIKGNLFDFETPMWETFNDFNHLLKINNDLFNFNIQGTGTYEEYESNNPVTRDLEETWLDNEVPYQLCDHICESYRFKNGIAKWPTCSSDVDGFCNGCKLPGMVRVGSMIYFQDHKWYDKLVNGRLKDETLAFKVKVEES
uniref:Ycf3-interacting protein 1, chloroplastic n=1 Tax=Tanacetum cinerariifolium TaxID=118510 RepID=A0A6L2N3C0_TANCI|nr:ycf3-interacting protein 1, chloroplastic [Tanacetum cinerariifolium]